MAKLKMVAAREVGLSSEELQVYRVGAIDALQRKIRLKRRNKNKPGKDKK